MTDGYTSAKNSSHFANSQIHVNSATPSHRCVEHQHGLVPTGEVDAFSIFATQFDVDSFR